MQHPTNCKMADFFEHFRSRKFARVGYSHVLEPTAPKSGAPRAEGARFLKNFVIFREKSVDRPVYKPERPSTYSYSSGLAASLQSFICVVLEHQLSDLSPPLIIGRICWPNPGDQHSTPMMTPSAKPTIVRGAGGTVCSIEIMSSETEPTMGRGSGSTVC